MTPLRPLLTGGDRRSIAQSNRARILIEEDPARIAELAALTGDPDPLVSQRALDLLEKFAHSHGQWVEPYKTVFIGPLAESERWEVRLQVVRALPLFHWLRRDLQRVREILLENIVHPQTFVRAWALDSLAMLAEKDRTLLPSVRRMLAVFEESGSKALEARARKIRQRMAATRR